MTSFSQFPGYMQVAEYAVERGARVFAYDGIMPYIIYKDKDSGQCVMENTFYKRKYMRPSTADALSSVQFEGMALSNNQPMQLRTSEEAKANAKWSPDKPYGSVAIGFLDVAAYAVDNGAVVYGRIYVDKPCSYRVKKNANGTYSLQEVASNTASGMKNANGTTVANEIKFDSAQAALSNMHFDSDGLKESCPIKNQVQRNSVRNTNNGRTNGWNTNGRNTGTGRNPNSGGKIAIDPRIAYRNFMDDDELDNWGGGPAVRCGARCKDGHKCANPRSSCPHHKKKGARKNRK